MTSELEANVVSIEKIQETTNERTEGAWMTPLHRLSEKWPATGEIKFNNYSTKYREELGTVLKDITCHIKSGEKVRKKLGRKVFCDPIFFIRSKGHMVNESDRFASILFLAQIQ